MQGNPVRVELPWERIGRLQAGFCLAQPVMPHFQASTRFHSVIASLVSCALQHISVNTEYWDCEPDCLCKRH